MHTKINQLKAIWSAIKLVFLIFFRRRWKCTYTFDHLLDQTNINYSVCTMKVMMHLCVVCILRTLNVQQWFTQTGKRLFCIRKGHFIKAKPSLFSSSSSSPSPSTVYIVVCCAYKLKLQTNIYYAASWYIINAALENEWVREWVCYALLCSCI